MKTLPHFKTLIVFNVCLAIFFITDICFFPDKAFVLGILAGIGIILCSFREWMADNLIIAQREMIDLQNEIITNRDRLVDYYKGKSQQNKVN